MAQRRIEFLSLMNKNSSDPGNSPTASRRRNRPHRTRSAPLRTIGFARGCRTKEWPCRKATNARRPSQDRGRVRLPRGNRPLCWTDLIPAKIELLFDAEAHGGVVHLRQQSTRTLIPEGEHVE